MTTPSSLEELRDALDYRLHIVRDAGAIDDNHGGENWTASNKKIQEAISTLMPMFRSHMEAVIEEVIGENDTRKLDTLAKKVIHAATYSAVNELDYRNKLREEQRQRAKSYLEGEK